MSHEPIFYYELIKDIKFSTASLTAEYNQFIKDLAVFPESGDDSTAFHVVRECEKDPILEQMPETNRAVDFVRQIFNFDTATFRTLLPRRSYSWHIDKGKICYHIPVTSNPGAWFVYSNHCFQLPADGSLYKINQGIEHTFVNAWPEPRIHLMFENLTVHIPSHFRNLQINLRRRFGTK